MRSLTAALLLLLPACGAGADNFGVNAWLRVPGAQFIEGPLPRPGGGPQVFQASISRSDISPGLLDRTVQATYAQGSNGILLGIEGDAGYWLLPAGPPDVQQDNQLKTATPVSFSSFLPSGRFNLEVQAVSVSGASGATSVIELHTDDAATLAPDGVSFTLSWDTEADLDLHVVDPAGNEIFWNHVAADGGLLDFDSNESCIIDGLRREKVIWASAAPSGHYLVRVDTSSLCSASAAHWTVQAQRGSTSLATVRGESTRFDTRGAHARGAGLLVLELDVP